MKNKSVIGLVVLLLINTSSFVLIQSYGMKADIRKNVYLYEEAYNLCKNWYNQITKKYQHRHIDNPEIKNKMYSGLIGLEYSEITTTLGNLEAKETANNPMFASIIMDWLIEKNIDSTKTVGVVASGSFPGLTIATLAALQTLKAKCILTTSLGASSYGANDPEATWIDIETDLIKKGGLRFSSTLITPGADEDNGFGLQEEGVEAMNRAAVRNNVNLVLPADFRESFTLKKNLFDNKGINLLINIGGNQTALGKCKHSEIIPNELIKRHSICSCSDRGLISHFIEKGIPVINLLNIRDIALKQKLNINPDNQYLRNIKLAEIKKTDKLFVSIIIIFNIFCLLILLKAGLLGNIKRNKI